MIQLSAIMRPGKTSKTAIFSFFFCIFTSSFTSTFMSYDWDNNKEKRMHAKSFYGYTPSDVRGKVRVFASLFLLSAFNLLTRSFACILLNLSGGVNLVAAVLGGELLLYFFVKACRQDLWYWLPVYGYYGMFVSFVTRWMIKIASDWTALAHFRHPNEVGGAYFTFSLCLTVVMGVVAAVQYENVQGGLGKDSVVPMMGTACAGMLLSYVALLASVNKEVSGGGERREARAILSRLPPSISFVAPPSSLVPAYVHEHEDRVRAVARILH